MKMRDCPAECGTVDMYVIGHLNIFSCSLQAYCKHNLEMNVSVDNVVQVSTTVKAIFPK